MILANFANKASPFFLLALLVAIIYFFILRIGDPTQKNISNNSDFEITSAYLIAPSDKSLENILQQQISFINTPLNAIPWSFEQHAYWIKINISNKNDKMVHLVSHFNNAMLDELSIFQLNKNNHIIKQKNIGDHQQGLLFSQHIINYFDFTIPSQSATTLFIRIASTGPTHTPIRIYQNADFTVLMQKTHLIWGVFIGVSIMIALYNLVLYFAVKDNVYLIYNAYILSAVSLTGIFSGYGFYLYPEVIQLTLNSRIVALNCLFAIFSLLFLIHFLQFHLDKKWPYWLAIRAISTLFILLTFSFWLPEYISAQILFILMPLFYLICLILLVIKIRSGLLWGKLYIYSWIPLLAGSAIQTLELTGKIEYSFLSHHAFMIAVLTEIILMAMALADRMRFQKELVIYNATHELSSGLANLTLLESHIDALLLTKKTFSVCLLDIVNYHALVPYMTQKELKKLEAQVIRNITPLLESEILIKTLSTRYNQKIKVAKAFDGRLAFVFKCTEKDKLTNFLNQLQKLILRELQIKGLLIKLTTKIGICCYIKNETQPNASEMIQHALLAIEQNKQSSESLHYYHHLEVLNIKQHLNLACDLQNALRKNKLFLYHQPQIDLKSGQIHGSEALLRWQHPVHGFINPELFIRIAEDTGLINELTRWVINCAFTQLQELHANGHLQHKISINISAKDISLPGFLDYVKDKIEKFNTPHNSIMFELTESIMVADFNALNTLINSFKELGIDMSIDDYGSGYSSLTYISQLQFDELKIDKAFILNIDKSARNFTIVKTTIDMARNLNLKVVGEGVESQEIEAKLKICGCDIAQGYYYTRPLPLDKYLLWLEDYNSKRIN